jgi:hypothetical protein
VNCEGETPQIHPASLMKSFAITSLLLLTGTILPAATLTVLPGEAIQPKIDAAAPGDIVAIFGGTYPDDLVINKAIRLIETDGQDVILTGNVTWNNVTNAPPFEGFTVGSPGKGIIVQDSSGLILKNVDAKAGTGIRTAGNSVVAVVKGSTSQINQDGGNLTVSDTEVLDAFNATQNSNRTVALRVSGRAIVTWSGKKSWMGYSKAKKFVFAGSDAKLVVVGTEIDSEENAWIGVCVEGIKNDVKILNSEIKNVVHGRKDGQFHYGGVGIAISPGNRSVIQNNYIWMNNYGYYQMSDKGDGIECGADSVIVNNIISGAFYCLDCPFGADVRGNFFTDVHMPGIVRGGVLNSGFVVGDPLFITGQAPLLQLASPCVNGGVADALFNDLDGTRNDIGPGGGCLFDPTGWTTDKPVVISFDVGPQQLLRGVDTEVRLSRGLGVGGR